MVVDPMTFHVSTVAAGGVCTCYLRFLLLCGGRLLLCVACHASPFWHVSDSVLACLNLRAFLVVLKLMLQSGAVSSCCRCGLWACLL